MLKIIIIGVTTGLEKEKSCPSCHSENVTIENMIPNKTLRLAIQFYIEDQEQRKQQQQAEDIEIDEQQEGENKEENSQDDNKQVEDMDTTEDNTAKEVSCLTHVQNGE